MSAASFVHAHAAHADWRVALAQCRRQVLEQMAGRGADSAPFTLGWCYLADYYAPAAEALLAQLHLDWPGVAWVGTAGVGVAAGAREHFDQPALAIMLAPLPRESFRLFSGRQPLPGRESGFTAHTALAHADGTTPGVQELLRELAEHTATGYVFGGLSSARNRPLHLAEGVFSGGLSGVLFAPEVGIISRVTQGCQPIGPVREVTRAEGNYVLALDGKPALDCALADLEMDPDRDDEEVGEALAATLAGLSRSTEDLPHWPGQFGADTEVRHLVGMDTQHRVLAVAELLEPGMGLAFCRRNPEAALADVVRIATEIRDELESGNGVKPAGALYVSCSGRGGPHFGAPDAELQTLHQALGDMPLVGFFAGGEIARNHLYGYTGVLTVFTGAS